MNVVKEIERHRLPCGAVTVSVNSVCRRRVRDHFDAQLDALTQKIHPEGSDIEKAKLILDGKRKFDAKQKIDEYKPTEPEETPEERRERLLQEGKMKIDVKKELAKYEEKVIPKPKQKTSDHSEVEEEEGEEEGNSKLLQRRDGKMVYWQGKG